MSSLQNMCQPKNTVPRRNWSEYKKSSCYSFHLASIPPFPRPQNPISFHTKSALITTSSPCVKIPNFLACDVPDPAGVATCPFAIDVTLAVPSNNSANNKPPSGYVVPCTWWSGACASYHRVVVGQWCERMEHGTANRTTASSRRFASLRLVGCLACNR